MKAIIFSDYEVINIGLKSILKQNPMLSSITLTSDLNIFHLIDKDSIAILILDNNHKDTLDFIFDIKKNIPFKVIVIDLIKSTALLEKSLALNLEGFLLLTSSHDLINKAIFNIANEKNYYDETLINSIIKINNLKSKLKLSNREFEILNFLAKGKKNSELASILNISESTVKKHISNILNKLNCKNRLNAVVSAKNLGLIS